MLLGFLTSENFGKEQINGGLFVSRLELLLCTFPKAKSNCPRQFHLFTAVSEWVSKVIRQLLWIWFWFYDDLRLAVLSNWYVIGLVLVLRTTQYSKNWKAPIVLMWRAVTVLFSKNKRKLFNSKITRNKSFRIWLKELRKVYVFGVNLACWLRVDVSEASIMSPSGIFSN